MKNININVIKLTLMADCGTLYGVYCNELHYEKENEYDINCETIDNNEIFLENLESTIKEFDGAKVSWAVFKYALLKKHWKEEYTINEIDVKTVDFQETVENILNGYDSALCDICEVNNINEILICC